MKPLRVGIVGTKFAATFHSECWAAQPGVSLVAVSGRDAQVREAFRQKHAITRGYSTWAELLADPEVDVVDICSPNFTHAEVAIAAMEAGKDVICEKPLATTVADGLRVVEAQKRTGRSFYYAEDWLFAAPLVRALHLIEEGAVGDVLYVKAKETHSGSHSPFAKTLAFCGGGALVHLGTHPAAWVLRIFGGRPARVSGQCSGGGEANLVHKDVEGEDWGVATLTWPGGQRALVEGNYITHGGMDDVVEVYGTAGVIKVDLTFGSPLSVYSRKGFSYAVEKAEFTHGWTRPAVSENHSLGYMEELAAFAACLRGDRPQPKGTTAQEALDVLEVVHAAYRSSREGKEVVL